MCCHFYVVKQHCEYKPFSTENGLLLKTNGQDCSTTRLFGTLFRIKLTCSFLKKYRQESALRTKNLRLHFETRADAQPGVVVGTIDLLNFHK